MARALFSGTFDPLTIGHLDIISRARHLCDHLYVGIGVNPRKSHRLFTFGETKKIIENETAHFENVSVIQIEGLIADFAPKLEVDFLIRGLRPAGDLSTEMQMAYANFTLGEIETLFIMSRYEHISSTLIRELAINGAPLGEFVPKSIAHEVALRIQQKTAR